MSFDVFGARRDAQSWAIKHAEASSGLLSSTITLKGYTGHEQIDDVGLVHMGGRVYDPILGRFLQADPFIQQPNNTQNLNRYSYVLNNPLNATDPSGYFFQMLVVWAVQYIAAATATTAIGTALSVALTAYSYYGYAQMAVGAIKAIEGGGTAMANFAGGMAKGFAKGQVFNCVMGTDGCVFSGDSATPSKSAPDSAKPVENVQGAVSADSHSGSHSAKGAGQSHNQNSVLEDSAGWNYVGGAGSSGSNDHGVFKTVGKIPPTNNTFWLNFTAGLADNYTWGLSDSFTSANSYVDKDSIPYQLGALAGIKGISKKAAKIAPTNPFNPVEVAYDLGYTQRILPQKAPFPSHGQPVFSNGKGYITPDVDGHNVTNGWKRFDRRGRRIGTWNSDLTKRIKD